MSTPQSPEFAKAAENVKNLKGKPSDEDLLTLYGLFKIATGEDIENTEANPKPGMFDLKGKAKRNAWQALVDEDGMTPEVAQERYVAKVNELIESIGLKEEATA